MQPKQALARQLKPLALVKWLTLLAALWMPFVCWRAVPATIAASLDHNQPSLRFQNNPGQAYVVETATNLIAPLWQQCVTITSDASDIVWVDDDAPVQTRFYRVSYATNPAPFLSLQLALERGCTNQGIVGASASAHLPAAGLWVGTFGTSDGSVPIRPQTPFEVGSVTKTLVSVTILRLVEEGRLSLDDTIGHWLPELKATNVSPAITVRQLLGHRAGVYNFGDDVPFRQDLFSNWNRYWQPEDVFPYVMTPYFAPGSDGQYSNTGYVLLGMIIRKVTGTSLAAEMRRSVLSTAGLTRTCLGGEEPLMGEMAHPHLDFDGDGLHEDLGHKSQTAILTSFWASGGEVSTAADLVKFGRALFEERLITKVSLDAMRTIQPIDIGGTRYDYGLGLMRFYVLGKAHWAHSGGLFGEYAWFSHCPVTGVSLGVVYNYPVTKAGPNLPGELLLALSTISNANSQSEPSKLSGATVVKIPFLNAEVISDTKKRTATLPLPHPMR